MKVSRLIIKNFRGISSSTLLFPDHVVLIGDNNTGKTTVLEALDLVLGPDRLNRRPPVDEHDFYLGKYLPSASPNAAQAEQQSDTDAPYSMCEPPTIYIEATISDLSSEQQGKFNNYIEWWDKSRASLYTDSSPEGVDADNVVAALRVAFVGKYDADEDDFIGTTYFARSLLEDPNPEQFRKKDKQQCGFLYLRSVRTGSRALSLEHGSLLDIILRLKEIRPHMWEETISWLSATNVASDPEIGISGVLESINTALKKYVPREWGANPHLKVSMLTRDHLRKVITAFIATGDGEHAAPFFRQGTGTLNMLVLAMLSQIASGKQNVIFAMEEPETAIPPYAQKRIVHGVRDLASQTIFTSHSPYVLEEFEMDETVILNRTSEGTLSQAKVSLPDSVKHKRYRQEFRTRFCEGLLSRRLLLAEGATEAAAFPVAARRLAELSPSKYTSLEALGICTIDAGSDSQLADLSKLYRALGKKVFAVCDKQDADAQKRIETHASKLYMHDKNDFEDLVLHHASDAALSAFSDHITWPPHLLRKYPDPKAQVRAAISDYFSWSKGDWGVADFLSGCSEVEMPPWVCSVCADLKQLCEAETFSDVSPSA
jgi:putative ATP-dependent endonuclease of OLD family